MSPVNMLAAAGAYVGIEREAEARRHVAGGQQRLVRANGTDRTPRGAESVPQADDLPARAEDRGALATHPDDPRRHGRHAVLVELDRHDVGADPHETTQLTVAPMAEERPGRAAERALDDARRHEGIGHAVTRAH